MNFNREQSGIRTLLRAIGAEIGIRQRFWNRFNIGIAGWWLELDEETVTAEGHTLLNLGLSYVFGSFKYFATVENLFDIEWNEAQFDTESRLASESEPISEIHFTPGNPRNIQVGISYQF